MSSLGQRKINFATKVMEVFTQVQKGNSVHKTHIYELVKYSQEDYQLFMYSLEQAYLKIFQSFHSKANKKIPAKFQTLAQLLFEIMLSKKIQEDPSNEEHSKTLEIFNSFLALCSQGIYSTIMNIRVMCCRLVFLLVKQIPPTKLEVYLRPQVQEAIMNATLHILRTKVSTYRQLGVKLASLILHFDTSKSEAIEKQLFKIMAVEDNEQIRKLVITNLSISKSNIEDILVRLRDKNPQIRSIIAKKLQTEKFKLQDMTISSLYKLLYDGYGSKQFVVKKQCLRYFSMFFVRDQGNSASTSMSMVDQNESLHKQFVNLFRPEILLLNPHLYHLFDELISDLLMQLQASMKQYIQKCCQQFKTGTITNEIIWIKNAVNSKSRQICKAYDQFGPTGVNLANILVHLSQKNQTFAIFELLQLFGRQKMPDEIGRNKMFDALKILLIDLKFYELNPNYSNFKDTDICHIQQKQELERKKLMLSYYDMPIISNSLDLIFQIGETMKALRPDHYQIQIKQVMSQWHNPQQNTLLKEKQLILKNISQMQHQKRDKNLLSKFYQNLKQTQETIEQQSQKTRKVLMCISRLKYNCDLQIFMPIIKEQLEKKERSKGLLLLGLYCLQSRQKVQKFWNIFWEYISMQEIEQKNKNNVLVSLKVVIDFIVKFNTLTGQFKPDGLDEFNADMFMEEMVRLMLHDDPDIRILAIQSLCRLLYHERVDKDNESIYFLYMILLWLETSTQVVSAKSVHTVSIFIKSYIQKGNCYSMKLAQVFCLFFRVISTFHSQKKCINKQIIKYNLTMDEFIKKTLFTVMTIFKYQKQSRNIIWTYSPDQSSYGPQEFILLYLFKDQSIIPLLSKALMQCDFFQFCGLECLIWVKKVLQQINESKVWKGTIEQSMKKLQQDIERQISIKNQQIFNEHAVQIIQKYFQEKLKILNDESRTIHKNLSDRNLFIRVEQYDSQQIDNQNSNDESEESQLSSVEVEQLKQEVQEGNREQIIRKRKKMPTINLSDDEVEIFENNGADKEQENISKMASQKIKEVKTKKQVKKQLPIAPIRNLRKRK